jgi:hypothetical protein
LIGANSGQVRNCYANGSVSGSPAETTGGLTGYNWDHRRMMLCAFDWITNCFFLDPNDGGGPDNGLGVPLTARQMTQEASFEGWDFEIMWSICEGQGPPALQWEEVPCSQ